MILKKHYTCDGSPARDDDRFMLPELLGIPNTSVGNWVETYPTDDAACIWGEVERSTKIPRRSYILRYQES
jgi:hypothetical protein